MGWGKIRVNRTMFFIFETKNVLVGFLGLNHGGSTTLLRQRVK
jgi:hypothetical protein